MPAGMAAALASQLPATAPVTRYQGVDKQSSGYKLLAAMGWKEGEGLGAARQGIKEHIKVKKKFENWGVGAVSWAAAGAAGGAGVRGGTAAGREYVLGSEELPACL